MHKFRKDKPIDGYFNSLKSQYQTGKLRLSEDEMNLLKMCNEADDAYRREGEPLGSGMRRLLQEIFRKNPNPFEGKELND